MTTSNRYASHASFSYVNCDWSNCRLWRRPQLHWCMHLSVAVSINATIFCMISPMLSIWSQYIWSQKPSSLNKSLQCYENFTGYRFTSAFCSSQHSWCTDACTVPHQFNWPVTVFQLQHGPGDDSRVPLSAALWTYFFVSEQFSAITHSGCAVRRRGMLRQWKCIWLVWLQTLCQSIPHPRLSTTTHIKIICQILSMLQIVASIVGKALSIRALSVWTSVVLVLQFILVLVFILLLT